MATPQVQRASKSIQDTIIRPPLPVVSRLAGFGGGWGRHTLGRTAEGSPQLAPCRSQSRPAGQTDSNTAYRGGSTASEPPSRPEGPSPPCVWGWIIGWAPHITPRLRPQTQTQTQPQPRPQPQPALLSDKAYLESLCLLLLDAGAEVSLSREGEPSPLCVAIETGHLALLATVLHRASPVTQGGKLRYDMEWGNPLHIILREVRWAIMDEIVELACVR